MMYRSCFFFFLLLSNFSIAQNSRVSEESREILTYPYDDANTIPILTGKNKKIYPYHSFDGFSSTAVKKQWKVVKLENDYIEVYILPEVGGKVWGAVEKSTGKDFIYRNDVMKFRNIALRGPWASGGIEFNFGIIGHSPATAAPVDYSTKENKDGSVSCIVGAMDLPSRTHWRVEIRLPKDKAYFETKVLWYNPTQVSQSYYNWMTGAAKVSDDLEFFYPGNKIIEHNGDAGKWPVDKDGHAMNMYRNNNFGTEKSVHIVGEYNDFMGGYYHNDALGFGHWALYDDMPGHKLWLWALSRDGEIWKDLLTDNNGQYMEFQAGRGFNQYTLTPFNSPITEMNFPPNLTDEWKEIWFPVKQTGGMQQVSPFGILNSIHKNDSLQIAINALAVAQTRLTVTANGKIIFSKDILLKPMDVFKTTLSLSNTVPYEITADGMDLYHSSINKNLVARPFTQNTPTDTNSVSVMYRQGKEQMKNRNYAIAKFYFEKCLQKDPMHLEALSSKAELLYRSMQYDSALHYTNLALQTDAYHDASNYIAGISYAAKQDFINALETLGWAARSPFYRTAAYAQMANIMLQQKDYNLAKHYAARSLNSNDKNISALKTLAVIHRLTGNLSASDTAIEHLIAIDPLNHFAHFEKYLLRPSNETHLQFSNSIKNEFPYQSYLEVLIDYYNMGLTKDAITVLVKAPAHPLLTIWKAFLSDDAKALSLAVTASPELVFPYRTETAKVLQWAVAKNNHWKLKYYLALNYWNMDRMPDASQLLTACNNEPDFAAFYASRAFLQKGEKELALADLQKAQLLQPGDWRHWNKLIAHYDNNGNYTKSLQLASEAYIKFKENYNLALQYAKALLNNNKYADCIKLLTNTRVLPFEGSREGKVIYEQAYINLALDAIEKNKYKQALTYLQKSKAWPENLGVGQPYEPDNRMQHYLEAICFENLSNTAKAASLKDSIIEFTNHHYNTVSNSLNTHFALMILKERGQKAGSDEIMKTIDKAGKKGNAISQWLAASYLQDADIETLENKFAGNNYFKLITRIKKLHATIQKK